MSDVAVMLDTTQQVCERVLLLCQMGQVLKDVSSLSDA